MSNEKVMSARFQQKHDIEENWLKATNFTPKEGEIIIYDKDENHLKPRIKIGNGTDNVSDLPFVVPGIGESGEAVGSEIFNDYENNQAIGYYSHAEGLMTQASGEGAHAEGSSTKATGARAHAEGYNTQAAGENSHAEGNNTVTGKLGYVIKKCENYILDNTLWQDFVTGELFQRAKINAHLDSVDGLATVSSNAKVKSGDTTLSGDFEIKNIDVDNKIITLQEKNDYIVALRDLDFSSNSNIFYFETRPELGTTAWDGADNAHTSGLGTIASEDNQMAIGQYNAIDENALFIVGKGVDNNNRSNAFTVDKDGNVNVSGEVDISGDVRMQGDVYSYNFMADAAQIDGTASFNGDVYFNDHIDVNCPAHFNDDISIRGIVDINGTLTVENVIDGGINVPNIDYLNNTFRPSLVGQKTPDDGEIFNDYENNSAVGNYSHAEGQCTQASGDFSHAEGAGTWAIGEPSHAEGQNTIANGMASHAEGGDAVADGDYSHAEGLNTQAIGTASHAEGKDTQAIGDYSHASGLGTIASADNQTAVGQYNAEDANALFIVGNGNASARSNAFTVDKDGNVKVSGNLQVEGANFDNTVQFHDDVTMDNALEIRSFATVDEVLDNYDGKSVVNVSYLNNKLADITASPWTLDEETGCFSRTVGTEVEFLNPPLDTAYSFTSNEDGTAVVSGEYRTTERIAGIPVYTCILRTGAGVSASNSAAKRTFTSDEFRYEPKIIRTQAFAIDQSGEFRVLPYDEGGNLYWNIHVERNSDNNKKVNVIESSYYNRNIWSVYVQIWYTYDQWNGTLHQW